MRPPTPLPRSEPQKADSLCVVPHNSCPPFWVWSTGDTGRKHQEEGERIWAWLSHPYPDGIWGSLAIASPLCGHPAGGLFTLTPVIMGTSGHKPPFLIGPSGMLSSVCSSALTNPHRACFLECPLETTPACHLPVPSIATSCSPRWAKKAPEVPPSSFPTALGGVREPLQYGDCTV